MNWNLATPAYEQSLRTPDALALVADGVALSYLDLTRRASRLARALHAEGIGPGGRVGILGSRSLVAVEAVLGVLWAGAAYVPLGVTWPEERLESVLAQCSVDALIPDLRGLEVLTPHVAQSTKVLNGPDAASDVVDPPNALSSDNLAYIIFTSGTTGIPKGVMASVASVAAYVKALALRKAMTTEDRASQFTELTFDPSIGEILVPWGAGASLHVVPAVSKVSPVKFIQEHALTIWGAAPAAIAWMRATRSLQPHSLPSLRYSSFGGEPLPLGSVRAWQAAAPNSAIDNLYGPTEATVDCVGQLIEPGADPVVTPTRGIVAIGRPHPGTELAVLDANRHPVPTGEVGELAIAGSQLTVGYLGLPELTARRFPTLAGKRWYLTGDLAMRDASGLYHHLGRVDHQVKIRGHRVELEDIEAHLRVAAKTDQTAAVAWPLENDVAQGVVGFVAGSEVPPGHILDALRAKLPPYMVPSAIHSLAALPLNANGKLDRGALTARLESGPMR